MIVPDTSNLKTYLGLTEDSGLLSMLHARAERMVKEYVGCAIEQATHTHYLPAAGPSWNGDTLIDDASIHRFGEDRSRLLLPELPVRSITSIYENFGAYGIDANWTSDHLLTEGTHFWLDKDASGISRSGIVYRIGNWPVSPRSVKVTYVAGRTAAELSATDIPMAVIVTVAKLYQEAGAMQGTGVGEGFGPITEEGDAAWHASHDETTVRILAGLSIDLPIEAQLLLQKYRRIDLAAY